MYLAMISIYNKFIEKLYKLDNIKLYLTNCYNFKQSLFSNKKKKTKEKTNNSPFRSNVKVSQS